MQFTVSKLAWGLLIALMIINILITSGRVAGFYPDVARIAVAIGAIAVILRDWITHRRQRDRS